MARPLFLALAALEFALLSCGGGGNGNQGSRSVVLTGTVTGTSVAAYDETGGRTLAVATGSTVPKSFSLTLTTGHIYALFLLENEGSANQRVYPLFADASATINLLKLSEPGTIDLGFVDTSSGNALPSKNPLYANGVSAAGRSSTIPADLAAGSIVFGSADLTGRWALHAIAVTPATVEWLRATVDVASDGMASFVAVEASVPLGYPPAVLLTLTPGGMLQMAQSDFLGAMGSRKDLVAWTATFDPLGQTLGVLVRQSSGRTGSELVGVFDFHRFKGIGSAESTGGRGSWARGRLTIDAQLGLSVVSGTFQTSDPAHDTPGGLDGVAAVSGDGTVTLGGDPSFRGTLSPDGNALVATTTDGAEHTLLILQRASSGVAATALDGTWSLRQLEYQPDTIAEWTRGKATVAAGVATLIELAPSSGSSDPVPVTVSPEGVVTISGDTGFQGTLSAGGRLLVGTTSVDSGATTQMVVLVK
ncbi:MAG TPA: hypothetical protein VLT82_08065 [Myxococcaceae bacterium]|nr:hypothetical protein [Myxococcaceae bacterium]